MCAINMCDIVLIIFVGLNTSLVPMYISEIAPLNLRGGLGTVNQLAVTIGLLLSQVLGIEQILGTNEGWPVLLGLAICPAILQLILLPVCPESPRYLLITKQWEEEARRGKLEPNIIKVILFNLSLYYFLQIYHWVWIIAKCKRLFVGNILFLNWVCITRHM